MICCYSFPAVTQPCQPLFFAWSALKKANSYPLTFLTTWSHKNLLKTWQRVHLNWVSKLHPIHHWLPQPKIYLDKWIWMQQICIAKNSELLMCRKIWCNRNSWNRVNNTEFGRNSSEFYCLFLINSVASWIYTYLYYKFCRFFRYQGLPRIFSDWGKEPWN